MRFLITVIAIVLQCPSVLAIIYVDQNSPGPTHDGKSWDTAFLTIQQGVNAGTPSGLVWVADGTYVECVVLHVGIQLYGGFLGAERGGYETDLSQRDFAEHIAVIDGNYAGACVTMAASTTVDGFTITHGAGANMQGQLTGGGVLCWSAGSPTITNDTIIGNSAENGGGIGCYDSWPYVVANTISDNRAATGAGFYCSACWPTILNNVFSRNEAAGPGGGIAVYQESSPTIDGNVVEANSATVGGGVYSSSSVNNPVMFTNRVEHNSGGAVVVDSSSFTIVGNSIVGNSGGGIRVCGADAGIVQMMANTVAGNTGGGIVCTQLAPRAPDFIICNTVIDNTGDNGGGICCVGPMFWLLDNTVSGNRATNGGGVYLQGVTEQTPDLVLSANRIVGNSAAQLGGGVCIESGGPEINGNLVAGNLAVVGAGGIACTGPASPTLISDTLAANSAPEGRGILCTGAGPSTLTIVDSVLWDGPSEIASPDGSIFIITFSDIQGGWAGEGNVDADPQFADPDLEDYHLSPDSPCIDVGNNSVRDLLDRDIDGDPRVCDGNGDAVAVVDMGCDEYCAATERTAAPDGLFLPAWTWFSIPLHPAGSADAAAVLGYDCRNRVIGWDDAVKNYLLYPDDFTDLDVGFGYMGWLEFPQSPVYEGRQPVLPFQRTLPAAGWCWLGVPSTQDIPAQDLLLEKGDHIRSPLYDAASSDPWLNWNWIYWDAANQTARIVDPRGGGDDEWLHPWYGYRVWSNTQDVTIVFP